MTADPQTEGQNQEMPRPTITIEEARAGEWVTPPVSYVSPVRRFCQMTGRPIARRYWRVTAGDAELAFAGPEEAARYVTYPVSSSPG